MINSAFRARGEGVDDPEEERGVGRWIWSSTPASSRPGVSAIPTTAGGGLSDPDVRVGRTAWSYGLGLRTELQAEPLHRLPKDTPPGHRPRLARPHGPICNHIGDSQINPHGRQVTDKSFIEIGVSFHQTPARLIN